MAYDGSYRGPSREHRSYEYPLDSQYTPNSYQTYRKPPHPPEQRPHSRTSGSRSSSKHRASGNPQPQANAAVGSMLNQTEPAANIHPEVLAQIVQQVTENLKASGINPGVPLAQANIPAVLPQQMPHSPALSNSSIPARSAHSPPSEDRYENKGIRSRDPSLTRKIPRHDEQDRPRPRAGRSQRGPP